jgi:chemotaxis protein CheD
MGKDIILGVGDFVLTDDQEAKVKVYALGSCVTLILYEPIQKSLAVVHIMAPQSNSGVELNSSNCGLYADTAVPWLVREFRKRTGEQAVYYAGMIGGAKGISDLELLAIGEKNIAAVESQLASQRIPTCFRDVGGRFIRSVEAEVATGIVAVQRRLIQRIGHSNDSTTRNLQPLPYTSANYQLGVPIKNERQR